MSIQRIKKLDKKWDVHNPFIKVERIHEVYPHGNAKQGIEKRVLDKKKRSWNMFNGDTFPGFPNERICGIEHIIYNLKGSIKYIDGQNNNLKIEEGDLQWALSGDCLNYSELFLMSNRESNNPIECLNIGLLQGKSFKGIPPQIASLSKEEVTQVVVKDTDGGLVEVTLLSGSYLCHEAAAHLKDSISSNEDIGIRIWHVKMQKNTQWMMPENVEGANTTLYFYEGDYLEIDWEIIECNSQIDLLGEVPINIYCGEKPAEFLILSGKPLEEISEKEFNERLKELNKSNTVISRE